MDIKVKEVVVAAFHRQFFLTEKTLILEGGREPLYLPSTPWFPFHRLVFLGQSPQSALHEISHWCIAGKSRRQKIDYGYWYAAEGRNQAEQDAFLELERLPQAIESLFYQALGLHFQVSLDNFSRFARLEELSFEREVLRVANKLHSQQALLPPRAQLFLQALRDPGLS
jgi:elongation factor P hydroxylase